MAPNFQAVTKDGQKVTAAQQRVASPATRHLARFQREPFVNGIAFVTDHPVGLRQQPHTVRRVMFRFTKTVLVDRPGGRGFHDDAKLSCGGWRSVTHAQEGSSIRGLSGGSLSRSH